MASIRSTALFHDPNLKAYYELENGALTTDSSGNGNTLTNHGTVTATAAKYGDGASITANTQWFDRATNLGITGGQISIVGWIKINTEPTTQQYNLGFLSSLTNQVAYWIDYEYNGGTRRLNFARYKVGSAIQDSFYNVTLGTGVWHHLALTYDGVDMVGYLDGVEVVRNAYSGNGTGSSLVDLMTIAQDNVNGDQNSNHGLYDDVGFFNRYLTTAEVANLNSATGTTTSTSTSSSTSTTTTSTSTTTTSTSTTTTSTSTTTTSTSTTTTSTSTTTTSTSTSTTTSTSTSTSTTTTSTSTTTTSTSITTTSTTTSLGLSFIVDNPGD
jgi:hypothetical protein